MTPQQTDADIHSDPEMPVSPKHTDLDTLGIKCLLCNLKHPYMVTLKIRCLPNTHISPQETDTHQHSDPEKPVYLQHTDIETFEEGVSSENWTQKHSDPEKPVGP